jgi:putative transposase
MLPKDFPCWKSVYHYFRSWRRSGDWERIYDALHELERERQGRHKEASAGCLDSQSVKNVGGEQEARGYDAGKKITGRKRHLLVDTIGLPIAIKVTAASESDQAGARKLFSEERDKLKSIKKVWVDGTYRGVEWHAEVKADYGIELEVKQNEPGVKGFVAVAKRWVVERTFGWLVQSRRLVREYEKLAESTEAMIHLTMIRILVRRLAPDFSD